MTNRTTPVRDPIDRLFDALADPRRRTILYCLCGRRQPMTVAELVEAIIEYESHDEGACSDNRVAETLRHVHLPKLEESGLIGWVTDRSVTFDSSLVSCEDLFELLPDGDQSESSSVE